MSDALCDGRRFRTFNVIDDFNREALAIEIDTGISAVRVVRILDQIAVWRGIPKRIRFDNVLPTIVNMTLGTHFSRTADFSAVNFNFC